MSAVQKSTFSTASLSNGERFSAWRESISTLFDVTPTVRTRVDEFNACLTSYLLDDQIMLSRCETAAQKFERSPKRPAEDGLDHYLIQTHLRGGQEVDNGRRRDEARPGDILILDLAERHRAATADYEHLTLVVPRPLLAPLLRDPDSQAARVLKAGDPLTDTATGHLRMLASLADGLNGEEASLVMRPTLALMASVLNGATDRVENGNAAAMASLMLRAKAAIERNLQHSDLSVTRICAGLGLSRASLYRLFEPYGGVRAYIQERRLRRAAEDLASPAMTHRYIYDIAFNWGFASEAHFSRAFKARFGLSPSDARGMGVASLRRDAPAQGAAPISDRDYETWLSRTLRSAPSGAATT